MSEGWYTNSVVYDKNKGGEIMYKSTPDSLVQFISGATSVAPVDIYYGKMSGGTTIMPTAAYIKANFATAIGTVGGSYPNPKQYTLDSTAGKYLYFCSIDLPSGSTYGSRAINLVRKDGDSGSSFILSMSPNSTYKYQQLLPPVTKIPDASAAQNQYFGRITIDGIVYRVWKSNTFNIDTLINVYNIT